MRDEQPEFYAPGSGDPLRDFDVPHGLPRDEEEQFVLGKIRARLPFYGSPEVRNVQFANGYAELAAVSLARCKFYGELLAKQYDDEGLDGLIGMEIAGVAVGGEEKHLETYEKSEIIRALVLLEQTERDRAASLIEKGVRLGMEAKNVDMMRTYGRTVSEALKAFAEQFGLVWSDEVTRRAAQRAVLIARERLGFALKSANSVGPALTETEKDQVRRG